MKGIGGDDDSDSSGCETDSTDYMPDSGAPSHLYGPTAKKMFHREYHEKRYGIYKMATMATRLMITLVVCAELCIVANMVCFYYIIQEIHENFYALTYGLLKCVFLYSKNSIVVIHSRRVRSYWLLYVFGN